MTPLRWASVDLLTGNIYCYLPSLNSRDPHRRTINQYESQAAELVVTDRTDPNWYAGTIPGRTALVAFRGALDSIEWGGVVLNRERRFGSNVVKLTLATPECYLGGRYCGSYTTDPTGIAATKSQTQIVIDLVDSFVSTGSGLPMAVVQVDSTTPAQRLYSVNDYDDKTVYSVLHDLTGLLNGPEFTAHWTWDSNTRTVHPILYVGQRIGMAQSGPSPSVTFKAANLIEATLTENYSAGYGANDIEATGPGQGLARAYASSVQPAFGGRPRWQYRFQPNTSIQDPTTLQGHSDRALALMQNGTNTLTLKAIANAPGAVLGKDWNLGDDIGYNLAGGIAFPDNPSGVARAIGYETDNVYTAPILYVPKVA